MVAKPTPKSMIRNGIGGQAAVFELGESHDLLTLADPGHFVGHSAHGAEPIAANARGWKSGLSIAALKV
jgi:hypothetical protein